MKELLDEMAGDTGTAYERAVHARQHSMPLAQSSVTRVMSSIIGTVRSILSLRHRDKNGQNG
jgi:hypothetical protein